MPSRLIVLFALAGVALAPASAQQRDTVSARRPAGQRIATATSGLTPNRDVILEIPELSVDSTGLTVNDVRAHVSLDANAMNFVQKILTQVLKTVDTTVNAATNRAGAAR
jgi:hypothetical protein